MNPSVCAMPLVYTLLIHSPSLSSGRKRVIKFGPNPPPPKTERGAYNEKRPDPKNVEFTEDRLSGRTAVVRVSRASVAQDHTMGDVGPQIDRSRFLGKGCDEALFSERKGFSVTRRQAIQ